jgi:para-nitrobenzyl esterase
MRYVRSLRSRRGVLGSMSVVALLTVGVIAVAAVGPSANSARAQSVACAAGTTVQTGSGPICGTTASGVNEWFGIPYAAPPVGALRWQPPQAPTPWTSTLATTSFGNVCVQAVGTQVVGSEDCLYLNVWAPAGATSQSHLPVLVNIHGGGFVGGSGAGDWSSWANTQHEVVVSINYRLGIFGFLANSALGAHSGDYGLQDQQFALRWVHQNVAQFGGDASKVTIEGASAGGSSMCDQIASPTAGGLFQQAMIFSGHYNVLTGAAGGLEVQDCKGALPTVHHATVIGGQFAAAVGCGSGTAAAVAQCLREVPSTTAFQVAGAGYQLGGQGTIAPTLNGSTLVATLPEELRTGAFNRVPVINGVARDEAIVGAATTPASYVQLIQQQYGRWAADVLQLYPLSHYDSPFVAFRTVSADSDGVCPALTTDKRFSRWVPVYGYEVDDGGAAPLQYQGGSFPDPANPNGSYHVADFFFLQSLSGLNPDDAVMSDEEVSDFGAFVRSGNPSGAGTIPWPKYNSTGNVLSLQPGGDSEPMSAAQISADHHCGFWNGVARSTTNQQ